MSEYRPIHSPLGLLWLHRCAALDSGPDWARRERLLIDAGATDSRLTYRGKSIPFHGHLFLKADGSFSFSDKDRRAYPAQLVRELETVNANLE